MAEYRYGMRLRGFSIGCQPKDGLIKREDSHSSRYYDIVVYDHPLTEQECSDYELDDLQDGKLNPTLDAACEATVTSKAGIKALLNYYVDRLGWTEENATAFITGLFEEGIIDQIKELR